jgi:hypothetical protein
MILVGVFRLDQIASNPKSQPGHRTKLASPGNDQNGGALLSDPNPRPWTNPGGSAVTTSNN